MLFLVVLLKVQEVTAMSMSTKSIAPVEQYGPKYITLATCKNFACVREAIDGNIIVVCENEFQQMMVWKLNGANGNPIWGTRHSTTIKARDAVVHPNTGNIVVTGNASNNSIFAVALNNGGAPLWSRRYVFNVQNISSYNIANPLTGGSNTYMITGESDLPSAAGTGVFFLQITTTGTPLASNVSYSSSGGSGIGTWAHSFDQYYTNFWVWLCGCWSVQSREQLSSTRN